MKHAWSSILVAGSLAVVTAAAVGGVAPDIARAIAALLLISTGASRFKLQRWSSNKPWKTLVGGAGVVLASAVMRLAEGMMTGETYPYPALADLVAFAGYITLIRAAILIVRARAVEPSREDNLDALILAGLLGSTFYASILHPYVMDGGVPFIDRAGNVTYFLLILGIVYGNARVAFGPGSRNGSYYLMASAVTAFLANDLAVLMETAGFSVSSIVSEALAPLSFVLMAASLAHPDADRLTDRPTDTAHSVSRRRIIGLALGLVLPPSTFVILEDASLSQRVAVAVGAAIVALLVTIRSALLLRSTERVALSERALRELGTALQATGSFADATDTGCRAARELLAPRPGRTVERVSLATTGDGDLHLFASGKLDGFDTPMEGIASLLDGETELFLSSDGAQGRGTLRSAVVAPIPNHVGMQAAYFATSPGLFSTREVSALTAVAAQTGLALDSRATSERIHVERSNRKFRSLVQDTNDVVLLLSQRDSTVELASPNVGRLLGIEESDIIGRTPLDLLYEDDEAMARDLLEQEMETAEPIDVRLSHEDGQIRWFAMTIRDLRADPELDGFVMSLADIHERKMAEVQLAGAENRYRSMIENSTDVFLIVTENNTLSFVSPNVHRMLGFEPADIIGNDVTTLLTPESAETLFEFLDRAGDDLDGKQLRLEIRTPAGENRSVEVTFSNEENIAGENGVMVSVRDISAHVAAEKSMLDAALHDPITGLLNRSSLFYEVQRGLQAMQDDDFLAALHYDIRDFKNINESLGFDAGDEVLREVAARLRSTLRTSDRLGRSTGDSFVVLTTVESNRNLEALAERMLAVFDDPIRVDGRDYQLRLSAGLASTNDRRKNATNLLEEAALAVRRAKLDDTPATVFQEWMREAATERFELETDLIPGLERGEFSLVYQPQLVLKTQRVRSVEALLRWNHPSRGNVSPNTFIPLAEKTGAIAELGRWVLRTACEQLVAWHRDLPDGGGLAVGVNVSARQLELPGEFERFRSIIEETGVDPRALTIELTETTMLHDIDWLRSQLEEFRRIGVTIAVDDFGTGAAGLNHLRDVPFDLLKIDKSYVDPLGRTEDSYSLLSGVIELAHGMGATVVAEGIETPNQASELRRMGCDVGQGFYLGRPMDPRRLENWFAQGRAGAVASQIEQLETSQQLF